MKSLTHLNVNKLETSFKSFIFYLFVPFIHILFSFVTRLEKIGIRSEQRRKKFRYCRKSPAVRRVKRLKNSGMVGKSPAVRMGKSLKNSGMV